MLLSIDPGNIESGYVIIDDNYKPIEIGKIENNELMSLIHYLQEEDKIDKGCIEMVASYGMAVGQTVFDTCVWIGRFYELLSRDCEIIPELIKRKDVKMNLCGQTRAKDSNIIQALIDRFAPNTPNRGKGNKKEPGWFYGFKADIWQAYALAVTYKDSKENKI